MDLTTILFVAGGVIGGFFLVGLISKILSLRTVVPTSEVHVVQYAKSSQIYGDITSMKSGSNETSSGNAYYAWPDWIPVIGTRVSVIQAANFELDLIDYPAADSGRIPFTVDLKAFFQISDFRTAARRISTMDDLKKQLKGMMAGACRSILAQYPIQQIMSDRSTFGDNFTKEIEEQLKEWGIRPIKNMELMGIEDAGDSTTIDDIQRKQQSKIKAESETEVSNNEKAAAEVKLTNQQVVDLKRQETERAIQMNAIQVKLETEKSEQESAQAIAEAKKITKEKELAITQLETERQAEIQKQKGIINAEAAREATRINAEAARQKSVIEANATAETLKVKINAEAETTKTKAEAEFEKEKLTAQGIEAKGKAEAEAVKSMELAKVEAQVQLAEKTTNNKEYTKYLLDLEQIKANKEVGVAYAEAIGVADLKIIANSDTVGNGLNKITDVLSSKGGTQVGAFLEGLKNTETGKQLLETVGLTSTDTKH